MTKWIAGAAFAMALTMSFGVQSFAQDNPCAKDRETLCPGKEGKDMWACMKANKDKLSAECKAKHEKMKDAMKEVKAACHEDFEKFCSDTQPGDGRIMKCMKDHKDELSQGCQDEMKKAHGKKK